MPRLIKRQRTFAVELASLPLAVVAIALVVLDVAAPVPVSVAEAVHTCTTPHILTPISRIHVPVRPSLHTTPAPLAVHKVSRVYSSILQLLDAVPVDDITRFSGARLQRAASHAMQHPLVLLAICFKHWLD